ncbi:FAD assembly factor SdhE [Facilibium subflavum]|uniref:FAD assembly factor SdhE n=1 Tax=Facilibium subflavum TaxID=2219058 RepID=UPI001F195BE7|nr:succinate dehydrogenase assembly factor 2 [Facilibium subflavum]
MQSDSDDTLKRIRWAARRGMLELDLVLSAYVENCYLQASDVEKQQFNRLLTCEDQDLFGWFIQSKPVDKVHNDIVKKVLQAKKDAAAKQVKSKCSSTVNKGGECD